jgi:hypothetical protein
MNIPGITELPLTPRTGHLRTMPEKRVSSMIGLELGNSEKNTALKRLVLYAAGCF